MSGEGGILLGALHVTFCLLLFYFGVQFLGKEIMFIFMFIYISLRRKCWYIIHVLLIVAKHAQDFIISSNEI